MVAQKARFYELEGWALRGSTLLILSSLGFLCKDLSEFLALCYPLLPRYARQALHHFVMQELVSRRVWVLPHPSAKPSYPGQSTTGVDL